MVDGTVHEADVIVYGTGFQASDFLTPMKVVGRGGVDLHERWGGDARFTWASRCRATPTSSCCTPQHQHRGERVDHVLRMRGPLHRGLRASSARHGRPGLGPTAEAHDAYNAEVDAENLRRAWGVSSVNSWYKNATAAAPRTGRSASSTTGGRPATSTSASTRCSSAQAVAGLVGQYSSRRRRCRACRWGGGQLARKSTDLGHL